MTTEGSSEGSTGVEPGGDAGEQQQPQGQTPPSKPQPQPPSYRPVDGTEHVFDEKTGVWKVQRVPTAEEKAAAGKREQEQPTEQQQDDPEQKYGVITPTLPDTLPDRIRDDAELQDVVKDVTSIFEGRGFKGYQVQRVLDLVSQFELEVGADHPPLHDEEAIRAVLKVRWGSYYDDRMAGINRLVAQWPELRTWLNQTGAGNHIPTLEALGAYAAGMLELDPATAQKWLAGARANRKSALMDASHRDHKMAVSSARILADIIERGEKFGTIKGNYRTDTEKLADRLKDRDTVDRNAQSPEVRDLDTRIAEIRRDPNYFKKDNRALHESLVDEMQRLLAQRHPGMES